jgi:nitroreductase / dihydropteridine reductase
MTTSTLLTQLNRRYATKKFDSSKKIDSEIFETLLESLRLSPSSFGLQGWGFVMVENTDLRSALLPYARGQTQIVDASHLIILCRRTDVDTDFVSHYIKNTAETREIPESSMDGLKNMILGFLEAKDEATLATWLTKQVYIAQGFLLSACAMLEVDALPMEWFDPKKCDEVLGLAQYNLASCVMVPVGYRADDDKYAHMKKSRFDTKEMVIRL